MVVSITGPGVLSEALKTMIADENLRKRFQLNAKERSKKFSVEAMVGRYEKIYSRLI